MANDHDHDHDHDHGRNGNESQPQNQGEQQDRPPSPWEWTGPGTTQHLGTGPGGAGQGGPGPAGSETPLSPPPPPPPPPAAPPVYDAAPPGFGPPTPPEQPLSMPPPGHLMGMPPVPPVPPAPPAPPQPWANAVAVALLNLSCLGLGYVLLRRWIGVVVCCAATIALIVVALPADPDGIPAGALIAYAVFVLLSAADAARVARRTPLAPWASARQGLVVPLALVLFAVPVGGGFAYGAARDEAKEQQLLDQLAAADKKVKDSEGQSFIVVAPAYRQALDTYQRLGTKHSGSRAGKLVPDRLQTYWTSVATPYTKKDYCSAVPALQHLRSLPGTVDRGLLGTLVGRADDPLAESWFECGTRTIGTVGQETTSGEHLNSLLSTFPKSPFAQKIEPTLRENLRNREKGLGTAPCVTVADLRRFDTTVDALPSATFAALGADVTRSIEKGDFGCGIDHFKKKEFTEAISTMTDYVKAYPSSPQADQARNVAIAAEIAGETPAAGNKVPSGATSSGSGQLMVISNDGPGEVEVLYTGPVTGRVTIPACTTCTAYPALLVPRGGLKPCAGASSKYPKRVLTLPPGSYQMLQKRDSTRTSAQVKKGSTAKIESGYSYTNCLYVTSLLSR
ncbi:tol-pal system YbgF family protein [Streptomyces sp. NPDC090025]|uniref:tetratricopeptide repeat protein n=1 Tax=Streptomyces sp. NPDC090025 TaxID=3365922 RepID=UPI003837CAEF